MHFSNIHRKNIILYHDKLWVYSFLCCCCCNVEMIIFFSVVLLDIIAWKNRRHMLHLFCTMFNNLFFLPQKFSGKISWGLLLPEMLRFSIAFVLPLLSSSIIRLLANFKQECTFYASIKHKHDLHISIISCGNKCSIKYIYCLVYKIYVCNCKIIPRICHH